MRTAAGVEVLLNTGVSRVIVGSAAIHIPEDVLLWFKRFGPERLCLALDVRVASEGVAYVHTGGWTQGAVVTLWDALAAIQ